ncbi:MAG TPA: hypothetical protein VJ306_19630 [Pyrinomonadaceae bacterium]|nr:hypothetical protein [Pyrinomonadaceae bacterium]
MLVSASDNDLLGAVKILEHSDSDVLVQVKGNRAYRLITRARVEEKVLELHSSKRELADAIVNADNSVIRNITARI